MGWIEFQVEVMKRLMQKDESQWPMDDVWIVPPGRPLGKLEACPWPRAGSDLHSLWAMMPHDDSGETLPYDAICEMVPVPAMTAWPSTLAPAMWHRPTKCARIWSATA